MPTTGQSRRTANSDARNSDNVPNSAARVNGMTLRESISTVNDQSAVIKTIVDEVVKRHSRELDEFVDNIKLTLERIKNGTISNFSDRSLEINSIKLPVLMYFAGEGLEYLGCESDVAKAKKLEEYNNILMTAQGTIPNRQALAENATFYLGMVDAVYSRAYKQLKAKLEQADKIFSALKKVLSKRMLELDVSRREVNVEYGGMEEVSAESTGAINE